jgi:hypothetical protein
LFFLPFAPAPTPESVDVALYDAIVEVLHIWPFVGVWELTGFLHLLLKASPAAANWPCRTRQYPGKSRQSIILGI